MLVIAVSKENGLKLTHRDTGEHLATIIVGDIKKNSIKAVIEAPQHVRVSRVDRVKPEMRGEIKT